MTITGVAGSGKSTLIHTLTTAIRKIFNSTQSVKVCAPTGCAASNIFGTTCHHTAHIGMMKPITDDIPQSILKELKKSFHNVVCLIIDERSLMSSKLLARMEYNIRHATNNGRNANFSWGNIPVVLLVGDDYQLPPVEPGAFKIDSITNPKQFETSQGEKLFNEFASVTMSLDKSKRVLSDQIVFSDILSRLRAESDSVSNQECYSPLARLYNRLMRARKWKINKRTLFKWTRRKYYANIV
jgi:ATP-dependent exoDNAse (exonuclease V) alpha subunit